MTAGLELDLVENPSLGDAVLDNVAWSSLTGPHRRFAVRVGQAVRYQSDVARFVALSDQADPQAWRDLAQLIGPDHTVALAGDPSNAPQGWTVQSLGGSVQMVDVSVQAQYDSEAVLLGAADVPEILELIALTKPGPFEQRTIELGRYVGIREQGRLVALSGERQHPPGWTEISAVCTHPDFRGRGLAGRLVRDVAAGIKERGERVLLHAIDTNTSAIRRYVSLGFALRRRGNFSSYTSPGPDR